MYPASLLPRTLLALVSVTLAHAAATTPYDPFRSIMERAPKPQEDPVCCLRPLTPLEAVDDDLFLSFEEWKSKQLAEGQQQTTTSSVLNTSVGSSTRTRSTESSVDIASAV